jgi:hypothetical protein
MNWALRYHGLACGWVHREGQRLTYPTRAEAVREAAVLATTADADTWYTVHPLTEHKEEGP